MVEEAGRAERIVMAHCHGKPGIMAALEAGVKTIEHGSYLGEECAEAMVEAKAILVPTRFLIERMLLNLELLSRMRRTRFNGWPHVTSKRLGAPLMQR
jgi:imidazolonepropionase-like amidohydrolase